MLGIYIPGGTGKTKLLDRFEGSSSDSSGNGVTFSDTNMTYGLSYGRYGQGAYINNTGNSYSNLSVGGYSQLYAGIWVLETSFPSGSDPEDFDRIFCTKDSGTEGYPSFVIDITNSATIRYHIRKAGGNGENETLSSGITLSTNKWYKIELNYNGSALEGYCNGSRVGTSAVTGSLATNNNFVNIGCRISTSGSRTSFCSGYLDEAVIENAGKTETQIKKNYAHSLGRFVI